MTDSTWSDKLGGVTKALNESIDHAAEVASKAGGDVRRWTVNGTTTIADGVITSLEGVVNAATATASSVMKPGQTLGQLKGVVSAASASASEAVGKATRAAKESYDNRSQIASDVADGLTKAAQQVKEAAADPRSLATEGWQHGREAVTGAYHGIGDVFHDIGGHLEVGRADIQALEDRIRAQIEEFKELRAQAPTESVARPGGQNYLDDLLVGADVLQQSLARQIPQDVLQAYALQYPGLASEDSFREHVLSFASDEQRKHFVTLLKGKVFEIHYVDYLNTGVLPPGYHADLATLANQPGYDIVVSGPDESVKELIQAKATDSVAYVKRALERYPDINVVTTTEVHQDLVMRGLGEKVIDGHVTNVSLTGDMDSAADAAQAHMHGPSIISLALIAFTSYSQKDLDVYQKSRRAGERMGAYTVAYGAGMLADMGMGALAADAFTPIPFLATAVSLATRGVARSGRRKWNKLEALRQVVSDNDAALQRMRGSPPEPTTT